MKVFINNRDLLTWPRAMAAKLTSEGHEVIFIDNGSTYQPLLDFYAEGLYTVHRQENLGHLALWSHLSHMIPDEYYAHTDPDLDLTDVPSDWATEMISVIQELGIKKCGLSLNDVGGIPPTNPASWEDNWSMHPRGNHPDSWGKPINKTRLLPRPYHVHARATDTTFAVYAPGAPHAISGVRIGAPYACRHIPFHLVKELSGDPERYEVLMDDEIRYYMNNASGVSTTADRFRRAGLL